ncbi:MAG: Ig-like domain-containing protein [Lachnospiraceae bacterium]|nr:Ig-like domain-containing protein [Lachnospiraceae bacterium]
MTKRQRRLLQLVLTTLVLSVLMPAWAGAAQKGLKLNKSKVELYAGAEGSNTFRLKVKNKAVLGDEEVTFKSSRPGIAQVDEKGLVTALKKGNATIIVKAGGKKATCKVTVKRPTLTLLTLGKIYLSPGGTQKISVSTVPSSG